jgi:hypothetical protein
VIDREVETAAEPSVRRSAAEAGKSHICLNYLFSGAAHDTSVQVALCRPSQLLQVSAILALATACLPLYRTSNVQRPVFGFLAELTDDERLLTRDQYQLEHAAAERVRVVLRWKAVVR